ncbi:hypothetical protein KMT30_07485 [Streptomyces sp. IBSBF 2953]|uniref:hypothetical protein n=1 Tax=Streptomyces TaxID=1883 RepID=UPI002119D2A2|nr:hypothetical protein [Streptomyces hayashii]
MLDTMDEPPQLGCYTTSLVCYLAAEIPAVTRRFAEATRLAVRTDLPASALAFSHHTRIDAVEDGTELAYRGAADWKAAREGLLAELEARGRVLAVANTEHIAWAPGHGRAAAPHWILIDGRRDGSWRVADHFAALTPHGEQKPFQGWLDDAGLARALTPVEQFGPEVPRRDRMALGRATAVPPMTHHRWLVRTRGEHPPAPERYDAAPDDGRWLFEPVEVLSHILATLVADPATAAGCTDDLWAAARHYAHRNAVLVADGSLDPEAAACETAAWQEIPKILRIAALSAARGRPRTGLVEEAFTDLIRATEKSTAVAPGRG